MSILDQSRIALPEQPFAPTPDTVANSFAQQLPTDVQADPAGSGSVRRRSTKIAERLLSGGFTRCANFDAMSGQCRREGNCTFDDAANSCMSE